MIEEMKQSLVRRNLRLIEQSNTADLWREGTRGHSTGTEISSVSALKICVHRNTSARVSSELTTNVALASLE